MDTLISHSSALWALRRTRDGALGSSLRFSAQPVPANAPRAGDLSHVSLRLPGIYTMDGEPEFITRDPLGILAGLVMGTGSFHMCSEPRYRKAPRSISAGECAVHPLLCSPFLWRLIYLASS